MRLLFLLNYFISFLCVLSYLIVWVSPEAFPISGFFGLLIPVFLFFQVVFFIFYLNSKKWLRIILPIVTIGLGYSYLGSTFSFDSGIASLSDRTLKVISGNARIFNVYKHLQNNDLSSSTGMIDWFANQEADVLCLMEYYNHPTKKQFQATQKISTNYKYHYLKTSLVNRVGAEFGQIIFSKYPIIDKGFIEFENSKYNQAIWIDIVKAKDTVRIYNVHLQSMSIEERVLFDENNDEEGLKHKFKDTFKRLLEGFEARAIQTNKIIESIESSNYPVVVCADLNDLPYSYSYLMLKNKLQNSFEEKGFGWGSTYNGKIPFLRIDNQFASKELRVLNFNVNKDMEHSDHFPISGVYELE